jgi:hypothetical protein
MSLLTQTPPDHWRSGNRSGAFPFQNRCFAASILLGPIAFTVGGLLDPVIHVTNGTANIAANASADPVTNALHLAAFVLASFLLPVSIVGMARLAMRGSPWLATTGGALGVVGWLPLSALTAQEDLTLQMAQLGGGDLLGTLWERFNSDAIMTIFLVVYIVGHLLAYVVLPVALYRARAIALWAAWTLAASTPLTLAFFATRQRNEMVGLVMEVLFCAAFIVGSVPAAYAALKAQSN